MNKYFKVLILFIVVAITSYFIVIFITPAAVMLAVKAKATSTLNVPVYSNVITHKDRHVVLPNPDFLYVVCGYNVWNGSLKISGKMPENSYYSFSLYSGNTLNYYIKNDRNTPEKEFELILTHEDCLAANNPQPIECVTSPTYMGVMMVRILIDKPENLEKLKEIQRSFKVEKFKE
jgi:uncharacterized membrane protein